MELYEPGEINNTLSNFTWRRVNKTAPTTSRIVYELWPHLSNTTWKKTNTNIRLCEAGNFGGKTSSWGKGQKTPTRRQREAAKQIAKSSLPWRNRALRKIDNNSPQSSCPDNLVAVDSAFWTPRTPRVTHQTNWRLHLRCWRKRWGKRRIWGKSNQNSPACASSESSPLFPKMFSTGDERRLFKEFLARRPREMQSTENRGSRAKLHCQSNRSPECKVPRRLWRVW